MTVNAKAARNEYTATAGQTVFNYSFKIYTDQDLDVYVTPVGAVPNDISDITTDYAIDPNGINNENGGFLTLSDPVNTGDRVTIVSGMPNNRTVDYQNSGDFLPDTVNADMDRTVSLDKQTEDIANRTPSYQRSVQNADNQQLDPPLPMGFWRDKSDGTGVEKIDLASTGMPTDSSVITYDAGTNYAGGVIRSVEDKLGDSVSTSDFGIPGDGSDITVALQAAIDALSAAGGGTFNMLPGTYLLSSDLFMASGVYLVGSGRNVTTITTTGFPWSVINFVGLVNCGISRLTIDAAGQTAGHGISCGGIDTVTIDDMVIKNTYFYGIGLQTGTTTDVTISNVILIDTGSDGIDWKNPNDDNEGGVIDNVTVRRFGTLGDTGDAGIDIRGPVEMSNILIDDVPLECSGIRLHEGEPGDANGFGGHNSSLVNFRVIGQFNTTTPGGNGVHIRARRVQVANGYIQNMYTGIRIAQDEAVLSNIFIVNVSYGIEIQTESEATPGDYTSVSSVNIRNASNAAINVQTDYCSFAAFNIRETLFGITIGGSSNTFTSGSISQFTTALTDNGIGNRLNSVIGTPDQ